VQTPSAQNANKIPLRQHQRRVVFTRILYSFQLFVIIIIWATPFAIPIFYSTSSSSSTTTTATAFTTKRRRNISLCDAKEVSKEIPKEPLLLCSWRKISSPEPFSMRGDEKRRDVHRE
jgi:hypothetical protein